MTTLQDVRLLQMRVDLLRWQAELKRAEFAALLAGALPSGVKKGAAVAFKRAPMSSTKIVGYASKFGERDLHGEAVMRGAFTGSLASHRRNSTWPLMLWMHDPGEVIGVWDQMVEDAVGLRVEGRLVDGVQRAKEAAILLEAHGPSGLGLSIGYRELEAEPATVSQPRKLLKLDLMEVSIVSFPALTSARVSLGKRYDEQEMRRLLGEMDRKISELRALP
jgi:HK97 family phage prohead protease